LLRERQIGTHARRPVQRCERNDRPHPSIASSEPVARTPSGRMGADGAWASRRAANSRGPSLSEDLSKLEEHGARSFFGSPAVRLLLPLNPKLGVPPPHVVFPFSERGLLNRARSRDYARGTPVVRSRRKPFCYRKFPALERREGSKLVATHRHAVPGRLDGVARGWRSRMGIEVLRTHRSARTQAVAASG
jgi:hypothetical protein